MTFEGASSPVARGTSSSHPFWWSVRAAGGASTPAGCGGTNGEAKAEPLREDLQGRVAEDDGLDGDDGFPVAVGDEHLALVGGPGLRLARDGGGEGGDAVDPARVGALALEDGLLAAGEARVPTSPRR